MAEKKTAPSLKATANRLIRALDNYGIPYAIVGGIAASYYGEIRVTRDLDVAVSISAENAERLFELFDREGFTPIEYLTVSELIKKPTLYLLDQRNQTRIDLHINPKGLKLDEETLKRRRLINLGHGWEKIWFISPEDLITMKITSRRPIDLVDVEHIVARNLNTLDWRYLKEKASKFNIQIEVQELVKKFKIKHKSERASRKKLA